MTQSKEKMSMAEFEQRLPEFFSTGTVKEDERLQEFLAANPDSAALVRDLEYIAAEAGRLLEPGNVEPSDSVWANIKNELKMTPPDHSLPNGSHLE